MDGKPLCNRLMGDIKEWDSGTLRTTIFPNFWQHTNCDYAAAARLTPIGPNETHVRGYWLVDAEAVEGKDYTLERLLPIWDITNRQDWTICEDQQEGVSSRAYVPGPYSLVRERNVAHFLDWYLGRARRVNLPSQARIVVIGGGAVGCSIAYHLGKLGQKDVLVLEKSGLTHGSTWHAAGLVGQLRSKRNLTRLMQYSAQLYGKLEAETGQATEWKPVGSLRLASSEERWSELKRMATTARSFDFELHTLSPKEAHDKFPLATSDGVVGAVFVPNDGSVEPSSLTMAYAKGARSSGVRIVENVLVTGFEADGRRIKRVLTDQGAVACEIVVDRRRHLGARRGARWRACKCRPARSSTST